MVNSSTLHILYNTYNRYKVNTMENEMKCCSKCGENKPATTEYFPRNYDGLFNWCKTCKRAYQLIYNKTDAGRASQKKYDKTPKGKKNNLKGTKKYIRKTKAVYGIFDNQDNCLYVGASSQFNGRVSTHKYQINNPDSAAKNHPSMLHLYEELAKYDYVSYRVLEECLREDLRDRETYYISIYNPKFNKNKK